MTSTDPASVLAGALAAGGVRCAEVTFRTPDAEQMRALRAASAPATPSPPD